MRQRRRQHDPARVRTPHNSGTQLPLIDDTQYPNIGDRLSTAGISWNGYAGGGDDARIPALLISAKFQASSVDHALYDTTSILATIERSYHLAPLSTRDSAVNPLYTGIKLGLDG